MRSPNWFITSAKGSKQGAFKPEGNVKDQKTWIPLHSVEYGVLSPYDVATGHTSGKRQHEPFTMHKVPGASSPQWFNALVNNETLTTVTIERYEMQNAKLTQIFKFELTNCQVLQWNIETLEEATAGEGRPSEYLLEEIKLNFQKIAFDFIPGKTSAMDDWMAGS
jgi:type VI secretion system secreted protein Hcp